MFKIAMRATPKKTKTAPAGKTEDVFADGAG